MKVHDPNLSPLGSAGAARTQEAGKAHPGGRAPAPGTAPNSGSDDVHLSELVRSLRSLAADSPERQAKIEELTRTYASGGYKVDAHSTADAIIQDALSTGAAKG